MDRATLAEAYERFLAADESTIGDAGKELIRAIFGQDAIAEDPLGS